MKKETASYLAGLIDGDGSFTISLSIKNSSILFTPHVRIALKENDANYLIQLRNEIDVGKIYYSNKGTPEGICSWQTTNIKDLIIICEEVIPYLRIKRKKGESILEVARFWLDTMPSAGQNRCGGKRTKEQITKMIKVALNLNYDRQVFRYREKKGWDYWEKMIDKLYTNSEKAQKKRDNRKCMDCKSFETYTDKDGIERWYKRENGFLCNSCHSKERRLTV